MSSHANASTVRKNNINKLKIKFKTLKKSIITNRFLRKSKQLQFKNIKKVIILIFLSFKIYIFSLNLKDLTPSIVSKKNNEIK